MTLRGISGNAEALAGRGDGPKPTRGAR